jgi:DNA-binding transcriptional regulator YhcF (GntR family)
MQLDPIHHDAEVPPFEQVRSQIAGQIAVGELSSGTRLPTVRALAGVLGLAVNTVARVYKELEADGLIVTEGRRGTFVKSTTTGAAVDEMVAAYVQACRRQGLTRAEALRLVEAGWTR